MCERVREVACIDEERENRTQSLVSDGRSEDHQRLGFGKECFPFSISEKKNTELRVFLC